MATNGKLVGPAKTAKYHPSLGTGPGLWPLRTGHRGIFQLRDVEEMLRDGQVRFAFDLLKGPIHTAIIACQAQDANVKNWVERQYRELWERDLDKVLACLAYGSSGGEATYKIEPDTELVEVEKLHDIHLYDRRAVLSEGTVCGVNVYRIPGSNGKVELRLPGTWWWITNESRYGDTWGRSRLEGTWESWLEKSGYKGGKDVRRLFYFKYAYTGGQLFFPDGSTEDPSTGKDRPNRDIANEYLDKIEAGATTAWPNDRIEDSPGEKQWEYVSAKLSESLADVREYIKDLDREILIGAGIPDEVISAHDTGSGYAGRAVPALVYWTMLDRIVDNVLRTLNEQVILPAAKVNFGPDVRYTVKAESLVPKPPQQQEKPPGAPGQPQQDNGPPVPNAPQPGATPPAAAPPAPSPAPAAPVAMSAAHSPKGGVTVAGTFFKGGEFIPAAVMAQATDKEKAEVEGKAETHPEVGKAKAHLAASKEYKAKGTRAAAFKSWFGNWEDDGKNASQVVDPKGNPQETFPVEPHSVVERDGKPVVVYHGTATGGFTAFDPDKQAKDSLYGPGFYFTEDKEIADQYQGKGEKAFVIKGLDGSPVSSEEAAKQTVRERMSEWLNGLGLERGQGTTTRKRLTSLGFEGKRRQAAEALAGLASTADDAFVLRNLKELTPDIKQAFADVGFKVDDWLTPGGERETKAVYLNIRKPFDADKQGIPVEAVKKHLPLTYARWKEFFGSTDGLPDPDEMTFDELAYAIPKGGDWKGKEAANWVLREIGYDGITHLGGHQMGTKEHRVWIAFAPTQIKAVDNLGTFDPTNPDIRLSVTELILERSAVSEAVRAKVRAAIRSKFPDEAVEE